MFFHNIRQIINKVKTVSNVDNSKDPSVGRPSSVIETDKHLEMLKKNTKEADQQITLLCDARKEYEQDKNINKLISVYESVLLDLDKPKWNTFGFCLSLTEFYIKAKRNNNAWAFLNQMLAWSLVHPEYHWDISKIRFEQFKILKSEKKYADALELLVMRYVLWSNGVREPYFNKNRFIKEGKTTAISAGMSLEEFEKFADYLEFALLKRKIDEGDVVRFFRAYFNSEDKPPVSSICKD